MPKARQTCTKCSLRRQKCDRKDPCTRCVENGEASSCSRTWQDGYDPLRDRIYPKSKAVHSKNIPTGLTSDGVPRNAGQDASPMQDLATTHGPCSPYPTLYHTTRINASQPLSEATSANEVRQAAPNGLRLSQAGNEPLSSAFPTNVSVTPSNLVPPYSPSLMDSHLGVENFANVTSRSHIDFKTHDIEKQHLQNLVPDKRQIFQLIEYHEKHLLWYHGCVHGPTFRMELNKALQSSNGVQLRSLDLRWSALLFSIMAASLTCTSDSVAHSWGFLKAQKCYLSRQWYEASISCLHLGEYTSKLNVYSIQAIQVLSMSAHSIGLSNTQFVIFGAALRIAQNLGLQRLAQDPELDNFSTDGAGISLSRKDMLIRREIARRIWTQLCTQDWFSIPSSGMYSIKKQHFTTSRPQRVDDENMLPAGDRIPVVTDSGNLMYDIASLMAEFHDSVTALSDPAAKYDQVLKYDSRMRAIGSESVPHLFPIEVTEASGPQWVRWARSVASIVQAHKIIMIHRSFLGKSFTDLRYTYTRWASIAASKTILREAEAATANVERPAFWQDQVRSTLAASELAIDAERAPKFH